MLKLVSQVREEELLTFVSLIIATSQYNARRQGLWAQKGVRTKTFSAAPDFSKRMNYSRFCEIKNLVPLMMVSKTVDDESNPWWKHHGFLNRFNKK